MNGNAVMYDVGKILTVGGATAYDKTPGYGTAGVHHRHQRRPVNRSHRTRETWQYARAFAQRHRRCPTGRCWSSAASHTRVLFTDTGARMSARRSGTRRPASSPRWRPRPMPRTYHSVAPAAARRPGLRRRRRAVRQLRHQPPGRADLHPAVPAQRRRQCPQPSLDRDGPGHGRGTARPSRSPPDRRSPVLPDADGTVTHTVNTDQRRIPLTPTSVSGNTSSLKLPADRGVPCRAITCSSPWTPTAFPASPRRSGSADPSG